jgi:hypothetical protein
MICTWYNLLQLLFGREWENKGVAISDDFRYVSNNNEHWLGIDDIQEFIAPFENPGENK